MSRIKGQPPANHGVPGAGDGGKIPPVEYRWQPGQSGNPRGRQTAGASIKEWLNQMRGWDAAQIEAVLHDKKAPISKVAAARIWVDAASRALNASGNPIAGSEVDRICDRTDGKPTQAMEISGGENPIKLQYDLDRLERGDLHKLRECLVKAANGDGPSGN